VNKYVERFWEFAARGGASECWPWLGPLKPDGYGFFTVRDPRKRTAYAHRHAYELLVGPIPAGLTIDHLEIVTRSENNRRRRGYNTWTHCRQGHEFTPENTYIDRRGFQSCRACHRETQRRYLLRRAA
jgi:hypothetical protein